MRAAFRVSLLLASLLVSNAASADNKDIARESYRDGTRLYDLADFTGALEAFKRAYFNYEDPAFLFNIAQCYRQLGNHAEAMRFYKTYLRKVPDAPNAEEVRRIIHSLEEATPPPPAKPGPSAAPPAATTSAPGSPSTPPPAGEPPHPAVAPIARDAATLTRAAPTARVPAYKRWWVWTAVGVVVAGAATGLALGLTQGSHEQRLPPVHVP